MSLITLTKWNRHKYSLTIINDYSKCKWVENIYKKCEVGLALKQIVTYIKNEIKKSDKRFLLD